jgi:hypothetical protein
VGVGRLASTVHLYKCKQGLLNPVSCMVHDQITAIICYDDVFGQKLLLLHPFHHKLAKIQELLEMDFGARYFSLLLPIFPAQI